MRKSSSSAEKQYRTQEKEFRYAAGEILNIVPLKSGKLLDVGCGVGWVVDEARRRGFNAIGIEPQRSYALCGRKHFGINIKPVYLENFRTKEKFDVIILKHVLEHIKEPTLFFKKLKDLLKPKGFLVISCPNAYSLMHLIFQNRWYGLCPSEHYWQFNKNNLCRLIRQNGFEVDRIIINNLIYFVPGWKRLLFAVLLRVGELTGTGDQIICCTKKST